MPIDPAHLARSLGALDTLDVEQGFTATLQQVLRSAKTLLDADRAGLMLVDHAGALRWASAFDPMVGTHQGELEQLGHGSCRVAFAQRAPAAVPDLSAEPSWSELAAEAGIDAGIHAGLSVPVQLGGGPVGTLDVYVTGPREWGDSEAAALQAYAGLVASLLAAAVAARVTGGLADQLQGALEHRSLIEQAVEVLVDREGLDAPAALEWLGVAARSSGCEPVQMARAVVGGAPLPSDQLIQAKAQRREATDLQVAVHRRDSELHEGAARRYQRRGQAGRAQTERLQAAAARGRIIDAEAERRRADRES
jgi:putative methionine-R-sulfoxide reductase with GAF domain